MDRLHCVISNDSIPADASMSYHEILGINKKELPAILRKWGINEKDFAEGENYGLPLRIDWYSMFKSSCWTLVPDTDLLFGTIRGLSRGKADKFKVDITQELEYTVYPYRFVAIHLEELTIRRKEAESDEETVYQAPYTGFPVLYLPLHPYIALHHAYKAFEKEGIYRLNDDELQICTGVTQAWSLLESLATYSTRPKPTSDHGPTNVDATDATGSTTGRPQLSAAEMARIKRKRTQ
ncbi:hypothetical protein QCA50_006447 [Cerrena zonata]|uniref:Uncharacterized protein n=1 Tax=Cerrena zonata TaxID=2478898 RepID=A0AAW0GHT4_9APHY